MLCNGSQDGQLPPGPQGPNMKGAAAHGRWTVPGPDLQSETGRGPDLDLLAGFS